MDPFVSASGNTLMWKVEQQNCIDISYTTEVQTTAYQLVYVMPLIFLLQQYMTYHNSTGANSAIVSALCALPVIISQEQATAIAK